ncbi:MAG: hypothetical protein OEU92_26170 [Alphaproteobacteria bacterium]|nr:hypothetical protein [Alphaproteobacteria bacterium]
MKTYLTREQWEQLCEKLGGSVAGGLALDQLGIECRSSDHKDRLDFQDVRSMAAELGEHIALRFSAQDDVRHAYPWLSHEQANEVAAECADSFDYEYRLDVFESYMRYNDLPIDPPDGWFEWTNEHGDVEFTTWLKADAEAAATKGWALDGFMESDPKIVQGDRKFAGADQEWVETEASMWPRLNNASVRAASKAIACINAADMTPDLVLSDGTQHEMKLAHEVGKAAHDPLVQDPRYCSICRMVLDDDASLAPSLDGRGWVHSACAAARDRP